MSRRELLALGGATLLVGCGKDEAPPVPPPAADVLPRSLMVARASAAAMKGLDARAPRAERELVRKLAVRAEERAQRVAAALAAVTRRSVDPPPPGGGEADPQLALDWARSAVGAYVEAMPSLRGRELRRAGADLVTEAAGDLALLAAAFGSPAPAEAFPGTPT